MKKLNRNCPICKDESGEVLHEQKFVLDDKNPLPDQYDVVCCSQCSFIYADVDATQEDYNKYYEDFSKYESIEVSSGGGTTPWDLERLLETANDIMNYIPKKDAKILDIGAAMGGLLNILQQNGYEKLYALEPSKTCVSYMKNEYKLNAYCGSVLDNFNNIFGNEKFDFVILSHVFEHIYDLQKAILNIKSLLSERGAVYIEVPDSSRYYDFYVVPYYYFDIEHINHFSEFSLTALLSNYGFKSKISKEKSMPVSENIKYPALFSIFELNTKSKYSINKYIDESKKKSKNNRLDELISSQEECVVWGAGSFTKRLLAQSNLRECNIKYFIDKDNTKQEKFMDNVKVVSPKILESFSGTIIIASALFSSEIVAEIKNSGLKNKTITVG